MEGAILIDVRTPEEFIAGHIPQAVNRPLDKLSLYLEALQTYRRVYVTCQSGGRSSSACGLLDHVGVKDTYNIEGGTSAWVSSGYRIE